MINLQLDTTNESQAHINRRVLTDETNMITTYLTFLQMSEFSPLSSDRFSHVHIYTKILTHLAYRANAKKYVISNDKVTVLKACGKRALADVNCYCKKMSVIRRCNVSQLNEDKSLMLHAHDLIFTTDLQTVNYYTTIHC